MSGGSSKCSHCSLIEALTFAPTSLYVLVVAVVGCHDLCVLLSGDDMIACGYILFQVSIVHVLSTERTYGHDGQGWIDVLHGHITHVQQELGSVLEANHAGAMELGNEA